MRLSQHIEKGYEDGLFISSVGCCSNLWALIMDAGTGFTAQVYELSSYFLHKVVFCFCLKFSNMWYYVFDVCNILFIIVFIIVFIIFGIMLLMFVKFSNTSHLI